MKLKLAIIVFQLVLAGAFAQTNLKIGFLPKINTSYKFNKSIKWVNSVESREVFYEDNWRLKHSLIDVASILSFKTFFNQSLNLGYIIRFRDGDVIHRSLQHYNFVTKSDAYRIGQRIGFEQEYFNDMSPRFRVRYRIVYERALNGSKIDLKEFYIKLGTEGIYNFSKEELEFRLLPNLGYEVSKSDKIEFGIDSRWANFLDSGLDNDNWLRVTWYKSF